MRTGKIVEALAAGDGVNENDVAFGDTFPYVALPHSGSNTAPRGTSVSSQSSGSAAPGAAPSGGVAAGFGGTAGSTAVLPVTAALVGMALLGSGLLLRRRTVRA